MAFLKKPFPNGSKAALNNLKRALLMMLNRIAVLASHLDALMRPAIAAIQQGVRGGELRHRRNEHFDGLPVDLNPDHPLIRATSLSMASAPRSRANMQASCSSLCCSMVLGLIGLPPRFPLWPSRMVATRTAYDAGLAHNSCSFPPSEMIIPLMV